MTTKHAPTFRLAAEAHIPHGSGDAEWRLIDTTSDNGDVIAIVDPNIIADGVEQNAGDWAEFLALAANTHGEAREVISRFLDLTLDEEDIAVAKAVRDGSAILARMNGGEADSKLRAALYSDYVETLAKRDGVDHDDAQGMAAIHDYARRTIPTPSPAPGILDEVRAALNFAAGCLSDHAIYDGARPSNADAEALSAVRALLAKLGG